MEIKNVIARFRFSALGNPEYHLKQILWSFGTKFVQRNYLYFQNWILKNHCPIGNHHPWILLHTDCCLTQNTLKFWDHICSKGTFLGWRLREKWQMQNQHPWKTSSDEFHLKQSILLFTVIFSTEKVLWWWNF